jgi:hypothetical protein
MKTVSSNDQSSLMDNWRKQIAACHESGLKKSDYCRNHQLSYGQMIYWQRKLAKEKQPALVPVKIKNEPVMANDHCICSLTLPGGQVLRIHDEKALSMLLDKWR